MKPCMNAVRQLNLKKKEKIGDHGVTTTNPHNTFWVLIPLFFTLINASIHETVAWCPPKNLTLTKSLILRPNIYKLEQRIFSSATCSNLRLCCSNIFAVIFLGLCLVLQSFTKYLRLALVLLEFNFKKFNFCFSRVFC